MLNALAMMLVVAGLAFHVAALTPARRLLAELPDGPLRGQWRVLAGMIVFFVLGYAGYLAGFWDRHRAFADLLVPVVLLCGGCFGWLVARASLAIVINVRRMSSVDRANITDALTGLHSRDVLNRRMREEMTRAARHGFAVSLILLDIDEFRSINDTFGHSVGDQVLAEIGRILSGSVRESDVLVRYGGEEVAVLAPQTPPQAAYAFADRLRRDIEVGARKSLRDTQGARRAITVSIGVAGREAGAPLASDLFELAEQALKKAKSEGRNRVVLAAA
jgi:diguanylate cyclase (GGDEF)-like protein